MNTYLMAFKYKENDIISCEFCGRLSIDIRYINQRGIGKDKNKNCVENLVALCKDCYLKIKSKRISKDDLIKQHEFLMMSEGVKFLSHDNL